MAKDALKETLGGALGVADREESQRLGVAVIELIGELVRELLEAGVSLIVEGNFRAELQLFQALPPVRFAQVHVTASAEVLRTRLLERDTHRHPVHYDKQAAAEIAARAAAGEWAPLHLPGTLLEIDTTVWPDLSVVFAGFSP